MSVPVLSANLHASDVIPAIGRAGQSGSGAGSMSAFPPCGSKSVQVTIHQRRHWLFVFGCPRRRRQPGRKSGVERPSARCSFDSASRHPFSPGIRCLAAVPHQAGDMIAEQRETVPRGTLTLKRVPRQPGFPVRRTRLISVPAWTIEGHRAQRGGRKTMARGSCCRTTHELHNPDIFTRHRQAGPAAGRCRFQADANSFLADIGARALHE